MSWWVGRDREGLRAASAQHEFKPVRYYPIDTFQDRDPGAQKWRWRERRRALAACQFDLVPSRVTLLREKPERDDLQPIPLPSFVEPYRELSEAERAKIPPMVVRDRVCRDCGHVFIPPKHGMVRCGSCLAALARKRAAAHQRRERQRKAIERQRERVDHHQRLGDVPARVASAAYLRNWDAPRYPDALSRLFTAHLFGYELAQTVREVFADPAMKARCFEWLKVNYGCLAPNLQRFVEMSEALTISR